MTAQSNITPESIVSDLRYLQLLSRSFPTIADASTEIINLEAILNLPKGTEHFLTDIHGEYEAFQHVLKNASGAVKRGEMKHSASACTTIPAIIIRVILLIPVIRSPVEFLIRTEN